jgi:hypothetical protein
MKENEILSEIHRVREDLARECNYDVDVLFARMNANRKEWEAQGWRVVSAGAREIEAVAGLREKPPGEKL